MTALVDQAQALRRLVMDTGGRRARTVAVTSGKGGVGKSNVAVNLAIRLTQMGRRVVLLDADLGTANVDVICDLQPVATLAHVVAGRRTLSEAMIEAPGGFQLIPGASGLAQIAALSEFERARLIQMVHQLECDADIILIDTGAGVGPNVLSFAAGAEEMLVVTTPEPTAITDAYAVVKTVSRQRGGADVRLLVNMVRDPSEGKAVYERIGAVARKFLDLELRYAGHVLLDPRVGAAVRRRRPFILDSPGCDAAICIGQLAHRMDRSAAEPRGTGLLERLSGWLAG
jgi:flagellar biosynthesis protein FlhG